MNLPTRQPVPLRPPTGTICVACTVLHDLGSSGCDGSLRLVRAWHAAHAPNATSLIGSLLASGATCDCQFVTSMWQLSPLLLRWQPRLRSFELPIVDLQCAGVRPRSVIACASWDLLDRAALGRASPSRRLIPVREPVLLEPPCFVCSTWRPAC